MEHDINLNIHYSAPEEIWDKIGNVYESMQYWAGNENEARWEGDNIDLCASVEAGGVQIAGTMPEEIWEDWYNALKIKLTEALGYEIGEPEDGYKFKYWQPFIKKYSEIKSIDSETIVFNDYSAFYWEQFEKRERDITATPPYFVFKSEYIELRIIFDESGLFIKKKNEKNFNDFKDRLNDVGIATLDLS